MIDTYMLGNLLQGIVNVICFLVVMWLVISFLKAIFGGHPSGGDTKEWNYRGPSGHEMDKTGKNEQY